jgi:hypothetical protein
MSFALFLAAVYHPPAVGPSSFQPLFTERSCRDQLLASPPFSGVLSSTLPLCCVSFQFLIYCSVFFFVGGVVAQGAMLVYPRGGWGIPHDVWCSPVWYAKCLPSRFGAGVWQQWEPSCFLSVMWHGDAFHGLGVQGIQVLILLAALFLPSVASASQWGFGVMELTLSASAP